VRWIVLRPLRERRDDGILRVILRVWLRLQWHQVECPLLILLPTTLAVWLLSFIVTFCEFTPPLILEGAASMILGPLLWRYMASAEMGQESALAALMASIMLGGGLARTLIWPRFWA
jgi:ABC-type spermidine/putrescine transport system permease subunit I